MKIRTDFVTNSSSSNTTEVVIDNPVLLVILQKYKDMGLFGNHAPIFGIGSYDSSVEQQSSSSELRQIQTPAFYFYEGSGHDEYDWNGLTDVVWGTPESLEDVVEKIINILEGIKSEFLDEGLGDSMIEELRLKNEEILKGYENVEWNYESIGDHVEKSTYRYDKNLGESLIVTDFDEVSSYDDEENSDGEDDE